MDSSSIPVNVCKLQETNETKIEETYTVIQQKLLNLQRESSFLRIEVRKLDHELALLDKEEYCLDTKNKVLHEEILALTKKTEEVVTTVENLKWKLFKIDLIKEFEQKHNESTYDVISENKETEDDTSSEPMEIEKPQIPQKTKAVEDTREKIAQLKKEIEIRKKNIQMTDPKLLTNMKMLEKRNAALLLRYQRQLSEAMSRYRQTQSEVHTLKRILAETNALLTYSTSKIN